MRVNRRLAAATRTGIVRVGDIRLLTPPADVPHDPFRVIVVDAMERSHVNVCFVGADDGWPGNRDIRLPARFTRLPGPRTAVCADAIVTTHTGLLSPVVGTVPFRFAASLPLVYFHNDSHVGAFAAHWGLAVGPQPAQPGDHRWETRQQIARTLGAVFCPPDGF